MYKQISTQLELDTLNNSICWDDSELRSSYIGECSQSYFPNDITSPGHSTKNYHCLYDVWSRNGDYLEIIFINCDFVSPSFLEHVHLNGIVRNGQSILIQDYNKNKEVECSSIIYRYPKFDSVQDAFCYFQKPGILDYGNTSKIEDGYYHIEKNEDNIFIQENDNKIEITLSNNEKTNTVLLEKNELINLTDALYQFIKKI